MEGPTRQRTVLSSQESVRTWGQPIAMRVSSEADLPHLSFDMMGAPEDFLVIALGESLSPRHPTKLCLTCFADSQFARAAITKYHRLGGLNNRHLLSQSSGGWKSKVKVLAGLVSLETSLQGFDMATYSLCLHVAFLCAHQSLVPLFCLYTRRTWLGPGFMISFNSNNLFKGSSHILKILEFQQWLLEGHSSIHNTQKLWDNKCFKH